MRTYEDYRRILELWELGVPKKRIGILLYIPRATVRDCIKRYSSLSGLEESRGSAERGTSTAVLSRICDFQNVVLQQAYAYVLGIYLGDGNITKVRNVYRLRVTLDARYPNIINKCSEAIQVLLPDNQIGIVRRYHGDKLSCVDVSCFNKYWLILLPQHGKGRKHEREIKLQDWQQIIIETYSLEFFMGLFHSDGSRFSNIVNGKDYPRYQFTNISTDIQRLFCETCDRLGLHWTIKHRRSQAGKRVGDIYVSKRKDVEYLDRLVGPKL